MTFCNDTLDAMLASSEHHKLRRNDNLLPTANPEWFWDYLSGTGQKVKVPNFVYISKLWALSGINQMLIAEILSNSFLHGNKMDPSLPVHVRVFEGADTYVMSIEDSGEGFDFAEKIQKLSNGERYWNNGRGGGLSHMNQCPYEVSFGGNGNIVNIKKIKK